MPLSDETLRMMALFSAMNANKVLPGQIALYKAKTGFEPGFYIGDEKIDVEEKKDASTEQAGNGNK